jgi:hypothetical protein
MSGTVRARVLSWPGIAAVAVVLGVAGFVIARTAGFARVVWHPRSGICESRP